MRPSPGSSQKMLKTTGRIVGLIAVFLVAGFISGCKPRTQPSDKVKQQNTVQPDETHSVGDPVRGEKLFLTRGCSVCHSIGQGPIVGPDLKGVTRRYSVDYLRLWILDPESIYRERGSGPVNEGFPVMGKVVLDEKDVKDIIAYLIQEDQASEPRDAGHR